MFLEVVTTIILLLLAWCLWENRPVGSPPGPIRIPLLGTLIQLAMSDPTAYIGMDKLSKKYGDVMSVKLGLLNVVVVSSYEATKEVYSKDETLGRYSTGIWWDRCLKQDIGLIFSNGKVWEEMRKYSRNALKQFGFGNRGAMEQLIHAESEHFLKFLDEDRQAGKGRIHVSDHYFHLFFLNLIASMVMGKRSSYQDVDLLTLLQHSLDFIKNGVLGSGLLTAYPFLKYVIPDTLGYNIQLNAVRGIQDFAKKLLEKRRKEDYSTNPSSLTDDFLNKIDEDASKTNPFFTDDQFLVLFTDLIQAGTETTSNSLSHTLLLLICHPDTQEKMYREIVKICGTDRLPALDDKHKMTYSQAVLLEGLRWARTGVQGVPKQVTKDFQYRDYLIKAGTILMSNCHTVFFDEEFWGDPNVFRPERFLDQSGVLIRSKTERIVISFGWGKRNCFGDVLARDSSFLLLTALIQKFLFRLPPNEPMPSLEPVVGVTLSPHPYNVIVTPREQRI